MAIVCQIVVVEHIGNMGDWQPPYLAHRQRVCNRRRLPQQHNLYSKCIYQSIGISYILWHSKCHEKLNERIEP